MKKQILIEGDKNFFALHWYVFQVTNILFLRTTENYL